MLQHSKKPGLAGLLNFDGRAAFTLLRFGADVFGSDIPSHYSLRLEQRFHAHISEFHAKLLISLA